MQLSFYRTAAVLLVGLVACLSTTTGQGEETSKKNRAPNVILFLADDMGYSDAGCYGGDVRTPNLDALAAGGLRFSQHYSTGRCWPSRACVLTGYYAQQIRRDSGPGIKMGNRPSWAPLLPVRLKPLGYHSYHSGKWHIDGNPKANGFERSWGGERAGCDWDRFFDSKPWQEDGVKSPDVQHEGGYYSTIAIADHAIQCLKLHEKNHADAPFFSYVAFYSPHFPLHALQKDIDVYRDAYLEGWDVARQRRLERMTKMGLLDCALSDREEKIKPHWNVSQEQLQKRIGPGEAGYAVAWDTLTDEQKKFQALKMAIHAAMITRMDSEIGRVVEQLKAMGQFENTLIMFCSDNGASAEQMIRGDMHDKSALPGSAKSYLCLGPGWATGANTPMRLHKHWNHEGGISSPFIVHWPARIRAKGEIRHNPTHFIDVVPTVLELAGGSAAKKSDAAGPTRPGISLVPAFAKDGVIDHEVLWWAHSGNRAIRMGDWKLSMRNGSKKWELYNLKTDRSEMNDLTAEHPEKAKELADRWAKMMARFAKDLAKSGKQKK